MADQLIFDAPHEFVPPSAIADDGTFQAMATFRALPGGKLELVDIEGYEVGKAGEATPSRIGRRGIISAGRKEPLAGAPPPEVPVAPAAQPR